MDLFRKSEPQESLTKYSDAPVQICESGIVIQADLDGASLESTGRIIPDHIGKSIRLTQGYKVSIRGPSQGPYSGKINGFHRHGFPLDLKDWLDRNVGDTAPHHFWEEGQGDWLYQGSRWAKGYSSFKGGSLYLDFRIRDRHKALLFKLTWYDTL